MRGAEKLVGTAMRRKKGLSLMKRNAFFAIEHGHCLVRSLGTAAVV